MLTAIGHWILQQVLSLIDLTLLICRACGDFMAMFRHGRRPTVKVYQKQVYFTGLEALKVILTTSLIIGTVIITQIMAIVGSGNESLTGKVLVWVVIRELGPLLTAIIVIARSGTAIATELGTMKINGEIDYVDTLGIEPSQYLIMPRIFGVATAVVILTVYFEIVSIVGGFFAANIGWHVPFEQFSQGVLASLTMKELAVSLIKSLSFGLFMTAACCRQGLAVGKSATQIPQAASKGVMMSLFLVFTLDGVITLLSQA